MLMPAFFLLAATLAQADLPSWTRLFQDASETTFLQVQPSEARKPERLFWLRHVFPRPRAKGVKYSQDQWQVDCGAATYMMLAVVQYDASGKVVAAEAVPLAARIAARVERASRMEKVYRAVCA